MARFRLSPRADQDSQAILTWTQKQFGEQARRNYQALIVRAILDVAADPNRVGSMQRPNLSSHASTYHLYHSRLRVPKSVAKVKRPRDFLLYRRMGDLIEIGRILHDSMEFEQHLPSGYRFVDDE